MSDPRTGNPPAPPPRWGQGRAITGPHLLVSIPPPVRSVLYIHNLVKLECPEPPPNRWWRFWHWTLLGWRWETRPSADEVKGVLWRQRKSHSINCAR
jgi:hypothetical protein